MNEGNYRENGGGCYFHEKEVVIGVCHLCLNERLLILAATKNGVKNRNSSKYDYYSSNHNSSYHHKPKPYVILPKIFAIASFFTNKDNNFRHRSRRRNRHRYFDHDFFDDDADVTSTRLEDESFISIKFGENGVASWDKTNNNNTMSKVSLDHCSLSWGGGQTKVKDASNTTKAKAKAISDSKTVVEHAKPRSPATLRWRKRIGQLLQVIRWKKSSNNKSNAGVGNNSNKVGRNNKGWIRTLNVKTKV